MTNWLPDITEGSGPLYSRLAEAIEKAIETGDLPVGEKLPPLRNLAFDIGVTVGTVSRAYGLARERGLVSGEVGRGTYVLKSGSNVQLTPATPFSPSVPPGTRRNSDTGNIVRLSGTAAPDVGQGPALRELIGKIAAEQIENVADYIQTIPHRWLEAGQRWLATPQWTPQADSVVPAWGAHAGLLSVVAAVTTPGDRILLDELTYASLARSVSMMGRRISTVRIDGDGTLPDDFERVCAQQHPKLAFVIPSLHNPTGANLPLDRRERIAESARRHNVWLLEDAVYDTLEQSPLPRIAQFAPERTFVVSSLSKAVAAGARGGWVACPPRHAERVNTAHKLVSGGKPYLMAELAARLVLSGHADEIRSRIKTEIAARTAILPEFFSGLSYRSRTHCPFFWLELPEPWQSTAFRLAAEEENILIDDEDEHKPLRTDHVFHCVRVGFTNPDRTTMTKGFEALRDLLDRGPPTRDSYA